MSISLPSLAHTARGQPPPSGVCAKPLAGTHTKTTTTLIPSLGACVQVINVTIVDDTIPEGTEGFIVALSNPVGATLGGASNASVSILTNDVGVPGPNL